MQIPDFNLDVLSPSVRRSVESQIKAIRKGLEWEIPELEQGRKSVAWKCGPVAAACFAGIFLSVIAGLYFASIFFMFATVTSIIAWCAATFHAWLQYERQWRQAQLAEIAAKIEAAEARRAWIAEHGDDYDDDEPLRPSWHVAGYDRDRHRGRFNARDRATMNAYGMTADEYLSNVQDD